MPLVAFAEKVKADLNLGMVRIIGDPQKLVSKVALCGGSAMDLLKFAVRSGADVYLTGEVRHNGEMEALDQEMAVVDGGD